MSLTTGFVAGATAVNTGRFVKMVSSPSTGTHLVVEAAAVGDTVIGVSQIGSELAPIPGASTVVAAAGSPCRVIGPGDIAEIEVAAAGAIIAGNYLTTNATGQAIVAATTVRFFAIAIESAPTGGGYFVKALVTFGVAP
jgi:hypothetical protein